MWTYGLGATTTYGRMAFESIEVIKSCLPFAIDFTREKAHNMLSFMLDPRYKGL